MALPPAAVIIPAVSSIVSGRRYGDGVPVTLRPVQYTTAPASPSARAMPRPAPRVAPATTATRPFRGFFVGNLVIWSPGSLGIWSLGDWGHQVIGAFGHWGILICELKVK